MILDSFFVALGFEVDTSKVAEFNSQAQALRQTILDIGKIAVGAAAGIGLLAIGVAESLGEIQKFAELNDVSARSVAAFGKVATENGSSLDAVKSSIESLNRVMGEAALGVGRGAMTFEKLGLSSKGADGKMKTFDTMLGEISNKMVGLSRQEQIAMSAKLGIDPTLVKVIGQGAANLGKLREEAEAYIPFTEEQYKLAEQVDRLYVKAKGSVGIFTKMIGASLLPLAKEVLETYLNWFKASRKATSSAVTHGIMILVGALGTLWDWTMRVVTATKSLYDWLSELPGAGYAVVAVLAAIAAMKTYEMFSKLIGAVQAARYAFLALGSSISIPAILIGGLILAIGLLIDDFVNFKEGNDSLIGSMAEKFPIILTIIDQLTAGVTEFFGFWTGIWTQLKEPIGDLAASIFSLAEVVLSTLWPIFKMVFTGLGYILATVLPVIAFIIKLFAEDLAMAVQGWVLILIGVVNVVSAVFSIITDLISAAVQGWILLFTGAVDILSTVFSAVANIAKNVFDAIGVAINFVFDGVVTYIKFIMGVIDTVAQKISDFVSGVKNVAGTVAKFLGVSPSVSAAITQAPGVASILATSGAPQEAAPGAGPIQFGSNASSSPFAPAGAALGAVSAPNVSTTTNSTNITGTQITVQSPDPTTAGASVRDELDRMNRQNIRNGQSQVAI